MAVRFLSEVHFLKEGYVQVLDAGQTVRHGQYGVGTVTESDSERTTVEFDDHGMKKFVTSIWSAEVVGEIAGRPSKAKRRRRAKNAAKTAELKAAESKAAAVAKASKN
jgi:arginine/ornithine N-succinyltransferase beta subunit